MRYFFLNIFILMTGMLFWAGCEDDQTVNSNQDSEQPVIEIIEPTNGGYVQSPIRITIKATATDNVRVSRVDFYIDDELFTTDNSSPYEALWYINKLASSRAYTLFARAFDPSNNTGVSQEIIIYVTN
jgi:hypothetical protein